MGFPEILAFSAYTTKKPVLFATKIRILPLYVNALRINQQALSMGKSISEGNLNTFAIHSQYIF